MMIFSFRHLLVGTFLAVSTYAMPAVAMEPSDPEAPPSPIKQFTQIVKEAKEKRESKDGGLPFFHKVQLKNMYMSHPQYSEQFTQSLAILSPEDAEAIHASVKINAAEVVTHIDALLENSEPKKTKTQQGKKPKVKKGKP